MILKHISIFCRKSSLSAYINKLYMPTQNPFTISNFDDLMEDCLNSPAQNYLLSSEQILQLPTRYAPRCPQATYFFQNKLVIHPPQNLSIQSRLIAFVSICIAQDTSFTSFNWKNNSGLNKISLNFYLTHKHKQKKSKADMVAPWRPNSSALHLALPFLTHGFL